MPWGNGEIIEEAFGCFRHALQMHPDLPEAHVSAAITHLLVGNLAEGWKGYRWRHGEPGEDPREAVPRHAKQGGLIALEAEQGLGDILFFLRWAASLKAAGARLAFRADPRLHALLAPSGLFEDLAPAGAPAQAASSICM